MNDDSTMRMRRDGEQFTEEKMFNMFRGENFNELKGSATIFFRSNLPDDCNHSGLWKIFKEYGNNVNMYIAWNKDRTRDIFSSILFIKVNNTRALEESPKMVKVKNKFVCLKLILIGLLIPVIRATWTVFWIKWVLGGNRGIG